MSASRFQISPGYSDTALIKDQNFSTMFPTVVPPSSQYNTVRVGPAGQRQNVEFRADNATYTYANTKMTIPVQSKGILDFTDAYLEFSASCTSSIAGAAYFTDGIWNIFNRIRVISGSTVVFDQLNKNVFRSMQWAMCRNSDTDATLGAACWGINTIANRQTAAAGLNYAIPLDIALLADIEIPFANIANVHIEFYFENPNSCVCVGASGATNVSYTVNNPRIRCKEVFYQSDLQHDITAMSPLFFPYTNYKPFQFQIPANSNTNQFNIPVKIQGVKRIIAIMRNSADLANPAVSDVFVSEFNYNGTLQYQGKIDNTYFPPAPIKTSYTGPNDLIGYQEGYLSALHSFDRYETAGMPDARRNNGEPDLYSISDWQVTPAGFTSTFFSMCLDLKTFEYHGDSMLSKFDTTPGNTTVQLNMTMSGTFPTQTQTLYVFVVCSSLGVLQSDGKFFMIE